MRIAHVIASLGIGGAETLLAQIAKRQAHDGHEVHIICLLAETSVPVDSRVAIHELSRNRSFPQSALLVPRLARKLSELRPDVVHAHMLHSNLLTRGVRILAPVPVLVNTVHAVHETYNPIFRLAYRALDRFANAIVFVSEKARDVYVKEKLSSLAKSTVVRNGIDLQSFQRDEVLGANVRAYLGIDDGHLLITAVGRLVEDKDYPTLLAAFSLVTKRLSFLRLLVVGDGPLRQFLENYAAQLGLSSRIHFVGSRSDIQGVLSASELLVLSSVREGFGLVLAEAMSCGVPVVSTDCGGTAEVVGDCGWLVPASDPAALADAILEALTMDTNARARLVELARERVMKEFSIDQNVANWYRVYAAQK